MLRKSGRTSPPYPIFSSPFRSREGIPADKLETIMYSEKPHEKNSQVSFSPIVNSIPGRLKPKLQMSGVEVAQEYLRTLPNVQGFVPVGFFVADISCDRTCNFCMIPTYGTGFRRISPSTAMKWLEIQKEARARSIN